MKIDNHLIHRLISLRLAYILISIITLLVSIGNYSLLDRFPWQDLLYADLQTKQRWRWFSEIWRELGPLSVLTSIIDFRIGSGEFITAASRTSTPIFDVGAWFYLVSQNADLSMKFKFVVYFVALCLGISKLLDLRAKVQPRTHLMDSTKVLLYSILLSSTVLNPLYFFEVGTMVLMYLFVFPLLIFALVSISNIGLLNRKAIFYFIFCTLLILGSSDIFAISTVFFLFIFTFFWSGINEYTNQKSGISLKRFIICLISIEFVLVVDKLPLILGKIENIIQSNSIEFSSSRYFWFFLAPLILYGILLPYFSGPMTLFTNFILILLFVVLFSTGSRKNRKEVLQFALFISLILAFGFFVHFLPVISSQLPSLFRYHVACIPIFIVSFIAFRFRDLGLFLALGKRLLLGSIFIALLFPLFLNASMDHLYSRITPNSSKKVQSSEMSKYLFQKIPNCVNNLIDGTSDSRQLTRSFIFLGKEFSNQGIGRDDTLTALLESPETLKGRTFNQWRYMTNSFTASLARQSGIRSFNSWPFTVFELAEISRVADLTSSPFLISTEEIPNQFQEDFIFLGQCRPDFATSITSLPFKTRDGKMLVGNSTLGRPVFLYLISSQRYVSNMKLEYSSGSVKIGTKCISSKSQSISLPLDFNSYLRVESADSDLQISSGRNNSVVVAVIGCTKGKVLHLKLQSHSVIEICKLILIVMILFALYFHMRKFTIYEINT